MSNLFTLKFWFDLYPPILLPIFMAILTAIIILFAICAVVFWVLNKKIKGPYRKVYQALHVCFTTNTILGLALLFFNYEGIPLLSARFWFLIWGIQLVIWVVLVLMPIREVDSKIQRKQAELEYKKYIP